MGIVITYESKMTTTSNFDLVVVIVVLCYVDLCCALCCVRRVHVMCVVCVRVLH